MGKFKLYLKLCYLFSIAMFVPGEPLRKQIDKVLADIRGDWAPDADAGVTAADAGVTATPPSPKA